MYTLTRNSVMFRNDIPVLLSHDHCAGPFDRDALLDFTKPPCTARAFVMRHLTGDLLPGDPALSVDQGANKDEYCWQFLTFRVSRETFEFAEFYHRLKSKGIKIPNLAEAR